MNKKQPLQDFISEVFQIWVSEKPNHLAAALAYFGMLSFSAVIYIAYLVAGIFINEAAAAERLYSRIEAALGTETATFIRDSVSAIAAGNAGGSWVMSVVSFISLLFVAMGLFLQITYVLNRTWGVPLIQIGKKAAIIRQRLFAFVMVIALGLMVIVATVVNVVFAWFGSVIEEYFEGSNILSAPNVLALLGVTVLATAFIYKMLPHVKLAWRDVWPGALAATFLMALGGLVIGLYFKLGGISSAFDAAGAYAVLMIAIYYFARRCPRGRVGSATGTEDGIATLIWQLPGRAPAPPHGPGLRRPRDGRSGPVSNGAEAQPHPCPPPRIALDRDLAVPALL